MERKPQTHATDRTDTSTPTGSTGTKVPTETLLVELEILATKRGYNFTRLDRVSTHEGAVISDPTGESPPVVIVVNGREASQETKDRILRALPRFALAEAIRELLEWLFSHH